MKELIKITVAQKRGINPPKATSKKKCKALPKAEEKRLGKIIHTWIKNGKPKQGENEAKEKLK